MAIHIRLRVEGPNQPVRFFDVSLGRTLIGRDPGCDLVLYNDSVVSRTHAQLDFDGEVCIFTHLAEDNRSKLIESDDIERRIMGILPLENEHIVELGLHRLFVEIFSERLVEQTTTYYQNRALKEQIQYRLAAKYQPRYEGIIPPGLKLSSQRFLTMLPEIYQPEKPTAVTVSSSSTVILHRQLPFLSRFLALFESVFLPLEWLTDHFDFYLDQKTTPDEFLVWLESWYGLPFDTTWTLEKRRAMLAIAPQIFAMRGTSWALTETLSIYLGIKPTINDTRKLNVIEIQIPISEKTVQRENLERMIKHFIPAHAQFELTFLEIVL